MAVREVEDTLSRDSVLVSGGTLLARVTGVARVVVIAAVLGPTTFGNTFQVANSLPNLVYYGFLAGSLVSSLLVPALVRHLHGGDPVRVPVLARGFLGLALTGSALALPVLVLGLPLLLRLGSWGSGSPVEEDQLRTVALLAALTAPQVALYAVAGTGAAVMYAHRRFGLPACAPAVENLGLMLVFAICAVVYGTGRSDSVPMGELLLLGLGSTASVGLHAGLQWFGARRCGVTLLPARGWQVPEVRAIVARALRSVAQAALLATQTLVLLLVAARVPGGVVALQVALSFYFLPLALVATPVGLALLPRLAHAHHAGDEATYWESYLRGLRLALFLVVPAGLGYLVLAGPISRVGGAGAMATSTGYDLVAGALGMLALGLAGAAAFFVSAQACYARDDTRSPLRAMAVQTVVFLGLAGVVVATLPEDAVVRGVSAAYAVGCVAGAVRLYLTLAKEGRSEVGPLVRALGRMLLGGLVMLGPVAGLVLLVSGPAPSRLASLLTVVAGSLAGAAAFAVSQALLRAPELGWLRAGFRRLTPGVEVGVP
jgi:putative peptidoglycan lipid II flippase